MNKIKLGSNNHYKKSTNKKHVVKSAILSPETISLQRYILLCSHNYVAVLFML